jgi:hypothetical protein
MTMPNHQMCGRIGFWPTVSRWRERCFFNVRQIDAGAFKNRIEVRSDSRGVS